MVSRPNARPNAPERTSWCTPLSIFISRDDIGGALGRTLTWKELFTLSWHVSLLRSIGPQKPMRAVTNWVHHGGDLAARGTNDEQVLIGIPKS